MLTSLPVALLIGTLLGTLSGLGVGGGSLLMLWLTLIIGMDYDTARNINLLFFLPCAAIVTPFRWKQGVLKIRKVLPGTIAGCISAGIFSYIGNLADTDLLQKAFGGILLGAGIRELLYRPRNAR